MLAAMAKDDHPQASIDWASATVKDGELTVALAGEPSTEWAERVQAVLERLERPGSAWGATKVTKSRIKVKAVTAGAEDELRHLLDGAVAAGQRGLRGARGGRRRRRRAVRGRQRDDRGLPVLLGRDVRGRPARSLVVLLGDVVTG